MKFGIIINHENRSANEIGRILKPIISDLAYQIKDISFIELDSNLFSTEEAANDFLKKNDYDLNQLLHIKADIGKSDNVEKFIIESASFMVYDMPVGFTVYDVFVDLREEVALRNPKQWSFSMANEVEGTRATRLEVKDMLYYYLGLSAVCNRLTNL
ncbi:MAG: hypothetical protein EOP45_11140 [Sphingobacteriaceae bacterium]|nr:MAG: hypothetical protein EOP45_11140 [Sphingobacteriaceae bacterium]